MSESNGPQIASKWRPIDGLRHQSVGQLRAKYLEVFGQESRSNHKQFLVRRIAWRLQANAEGDLSDRARQRALALAEEADLRIRAPQSFWKELSGPTGTRPCDARLPKPGSRLSRQFRGQSVSVEVLEKGFRYQERVYQSLSAVALAGDRRAVEWILVLWPDRQRGAPAWALIEGHLNRASQSHARCAVQSTRESRPKKG